MNITTIINLQIFIQAHTEKLVNRDKLIAHIKEYNIDIETWYYSLLTLHSFQVDTELKMLEIKNIWEVVKWEMS